MTELTRLNTAALLLALAAVPAHAQVPLTPPRTLWAGAGDGATVSPDGNRVAFIDWSSSDVAVRHLITGAVTQLTGPGALAQSAGFPEPYLVFSPDGDSIAFPFGNTEAAAPFRYELRLAGPEGSVQRVLATCPPEVEFLAPLDWDAELGILFTTVAADGTSQLMLIRPLDRQSRLIEQRPAGTGIIHRALFAPDRQSVVYLADGSLQQVATSGGVAHRPGVDADALLGWSAEGRKLVFHAARGNVVGNWAIELRDGQLTGPPALELLTRPGVLAAGQSRMGIAYLEPAGSPGLHTVMLDPGRGRILRAPEALALPWDGVPGSPSWSRDGSRLAFALRAPNRTLNRIMVSEGPAGPWREVARIDLRVMGLEWSADDRFLIVGGRADTRQGAWLGRIDVTSGAVEHLVSAPVNALAAGPKQEVAYVHAAPAGERTVRLMVLDEPGAQPRVVSTYTAAELPRTISVSPDGQWIALVKSADAARASTLVLVPFAGGEARTLLRVERPDLIELNVGGLPWLPGSDRVIIAVRRDGRRELAVVDVHSAEIGGVPFSPQRGGRWHPALRADGVTLVYIDGTEANDLKLMPSTQDAGQGREKQ